jgi:MFS family permease
MKNRLNKTAQRSIGLLLLARFFERLAFYLVLSILLRFLMVIVQPGVQNIGLYYSSFMVTLTITTFFAGLLGDKRNRNKVVITGFVLLTTMYLAVPFLSGVRFLLITAFVLMGAGVGLTLPNLVVLLGNLYNEKDNEFRGLSGFILYTFMAELGGLLAPLSTSFLNARWGFTPIFLLAAACGLVALLLFMQFTRTYRLPDPAAAQQPNQPSVSMRIQHRVILWSVLITAMMISFSLQLRGTTLVMALKDFTGWSTELSSILTPMEGYLLPLLVLLFFGWVMRTKSMHWGRIFQLMLLGLAFTIVGYLSFAGFTSLKEFIGEKFIIYPSYTFLLIAESMLASIFLYAVYRSSPVKYKGLFQGIYYAVLGVAGSLLFTGRSLYRSMGPMLFVLIASLLLINAVVIIWLKRHIAREEKINLSA